PNFLKKNYYIKTNKDVSSAFRSIYSSEEIKSYVQNEQKKLFSRMIYGERINLIFAKKLIH
ncbi:hypothetical protein P7D62_22960, partial [Enterococcus avium]|uniref:hypothetical protein n=1 Tax=Enterococcus avium TaxID=33945 RepID=UPI00288CC5E3